MDKILVTDELIISLIKEKNYEDAWGYCKYMGYPIVKDGIIRESLFMRFAKHFDYENNDNFIMDYIGHLQDYNNRMLSNTNTEYAPEKKQTYKIKKG